MEEERDEIESDSRGAQMDEAKEIYDEVYANVPESERPGFSEWLAEQKHHD